jgi:hypothetical protein
MWKLITRGWPLFLLIALTGCMTTGRPLPKADLSQPGWMVQQGQAVWHRPPSRVSEIPHNAGQHPPQKAFDIAGDLIVATKPDGSAFVQFSKIPLTFAVAQATPGTWQIEIPPQNKRYSGGGKAPGQIVWLQLANALSHKPLAKDWTWRESEGNWRLQNSSSGESLEGFLAPQ